MERDQIRARVSDSKLQDRVKTYGFRKDATGRAAAMEDITELVVDLIIQSKGTSQNAN